MMADTSDKRKDFNDIHEQGEPSWAVNRKRCTELQSKDDESDHQSQCLEQLGCAMFREPCLEPKHNIFLSHSGAEKNFTEQLCKDLERVFYFPFFDKRPDSLPKGEKFPPLILQAARQCRIAILVLSEDYFTRSKWPMIELNEFVQAQASTNPGLKILPLFLGMKVSQFKDKKKQKQWQKKWKDWASKDGKIDVRQWVEALSKVLGPWNGMEYDERAGEVWYREKVVGAVCKLVPPDVKYCVAHVQSLPKLCEPILQKLDEEVNPQSKYGVRVVGVYGMGGVGKTTISKVMCNVHFGGFDGKVCHVELGGKNLGELRKRVLEELTGASKENLPNDMDKNVGKLVCSNVNSNVSQFGQLEGLLKNRMPHHKVFMSLDNVWENDLEEARMYLELGYQSGSKVLVTSRSLSVLESLRLSASSDCMEMPELDEESATKLFLHHVGCTDENFDEERWNMIRRCVRACQFRKTNIADRENEGGVEVDGRSCESRSRQYLPLALKVWGIQLGHISREDPMRWARSLESLGKHKFNVSKKRDHPVFSVLRIGYDALAEKEQEVFLDLALLAPFVGTDYFRLDEFNVLEWLSIIHKCSKDDIVGSLNALERNALVEYSVREDRMFQTYLEYKVHDLYVDFGHEEVQVGPFEGRRFVYDVNGIDAPHKLLKSPIGGCWGCMERLWISNSKSRSLKKARLHLCPNVENLQLYNCDQLEEVDVEGMESLTSLDIIGCERLGDKLEGVGKLKNLGWFRWLGIVKYAPFIFSGLSSMTTLQVLHLDWGWFSGPGRKWRAPDLSGCISLQELYLNGGDNLEDFPDLSNLLKLQKIRFSFFMGSDGRMLSGLSSLTNLKILDLAACYKVEELPGLSDLVALEVADLTFCRNLAGLGDLRKLRHLHTLTLHGCNSLTSLIGLEYVTSLRHLVVALCWSLRELPNCSHLKELEEVDLSDSGVSILPSGFLRLARRRIWNMKGCKDLFEPLVVCLLEQQHQMVGGFHGQNLISGSTCKQSRDHEQVWENIRNDVAHYMDQVLSSRFPVGFEVEENNLVSSACMLKEMEGGVESLIQVLCDHDDMGILCMVVAKYAAKGECWAKLTAESTIQQLSQRVVHFLDEQLSALKSYGRAEYSSLFYRIIFIVKHLTENEIMATALGGHGICNFIRRCLTDLGYMAGNRRKIFERALERCKVGDWN